MHCFTSRVITISIIMFISGMIIASTVAAEIPVPPIELYLDSYTGSDLDVIVMLEPMQEVEFPVRAAGFHGNYTFDTPVDIRMAVFTGGPYEADTTFCRFFGLRFVEEDEDEEEEPEELEKLGELEEEMDEGDDEEEEEEKEEEERKRFRSEVWTKQTTTDSPPERRLKEVVVSEPFQREELIVDIEGVTRVYCVAYVVEREAQTNWDEFLRNSQH